MEKKINNSIFLFGRRNIGEFIKKNINNNISPEKWGVREILIKKNPSKDIQSEIIQYIPSFIKITYVSNGDLDTLLPGKNHQGVVLLNQGRKESSTYKNADDLFENLTDQKETILVLDRIMDTGNLGGILRTAECFGVNHILVPERDMAPINETVERISSGALHYLNIYRVTNLNFVLEKLKDIGYWVVTTSDSGSEDWSGLPSSNELAIVLGNEEKGVKKLLGDNSDFKLRIPMHGQISSLNVTVSCGIVLDRIINRSE
jgi:23S rRNA (guanosine2251-2'-O)-methyltransferase